MHPDQQALLAAIRQAPSDDAPRLIYADWLEERGQADYAGFIRHSVRNHLKRSEGEITWSRGFIDTLDCNFSYCLKHLSRLLQENPIRYVRLTDWPEWKQIGRGSNKYRLVGLDTVFYVAPGDVIPEVGVRFEWPGVEFRWPLGSPAPRPAVVDGDSQPQRLF